jgi:hypothetical protein
LTDDVELAFDGLIGVDVAAVDAEPTSTLSTAASSWVYRDEVLLPASSLLSSGSINGVSPFPAVLRLLCCIRSRAQYPDDLMDYDYLITF